MAAFQALRRLSELLIKCEGRFIQQVSFYGSLPLAVTLPQTASLTHSHLRWRFEGDINLQASNCKPSAAVGVKYCVIGFYLQQLLL